MVFFSFFMKSQQKPLWCLRTEFISPQEVWSLFIDALLMYHLVRRVGGEAPSMCTYSPLTPFSVGVPGWSWETMGKGFYISKVAGIVGGVLAVGAVATIIALSVVYVQEKAKNNQNVPAPTTDLPTTAVTNATTTPGPSKPWDDYRLPESLVPHSYHVSLWPRLTPDNETGLYIFTGKASRVKNRLIFISFVLSANKNLRVFLVDNTALSPCCRHILRWIWVCKCDRCDSYPLK